MSKKYLAISENLYHIKYAILRRIIYGYEINGKTHDLNSIKSICFELEGKTYEELQKIHERELGYKSKRAEIN